MKKKTKKNDYEVLHKDNHENTHEVTHKDTPTDNQEDSKDDTCENSQLTKRKVSNRKYMRTSIRALTRIAFC